MAVRYKNPAQARELKVAKRLQLFYLGLSVGYCVVAWRAVHLMLKDNHPLEEMAMTQYRAAIQQETHRSRILDRKGRELAISVPAWSLYADPREVEDVSRTSETLGRILKIPPQTLRRQLNSNRKFVWVKRRVGPQTMEHVADLSLKGIYFLKENTRFYPHGELAGSLLGAVGIDNQALGGIELAYDAYLKTLPKAELYFKDARGKVYDTPKTLGTARANGDVYLTLDKNVQFFAEEALHKAARTTKSKAGVIAVMESGTGAVLAMAGYPPFDPNRYQQSVWKNWRNRAVTDIYEPGSTFKSITVAAALEAKAVTMHEKFFCENGRFQFPGSIQVVHDSTPHGHLTVSEIIKVSSNIGSYKIGQRVGKKRFYEMIRAFGFGQKTDIDFPGESAGIVRPPEEWSRVDEGSMAFGHGIGATPLQILSAYAAIANDGIRMRPHLVEKIVGPEGEIQYQAEYKALSRPIRPEAAEALRKMLASVVGEGGTSPLAAMEEYHVAGKSGTARKTDPDRRGYMEGKYIASFVGLAPLKDPQVVTFVLLDEPQGDYYGGHIAAPVFKTVMQYALSSLGVPPDAPAEALRLASAPVAMAELKNPSSETIRRQGDLFEIPDFRGASMRQVLRSTGEFPIRMHFRGTGGAIKQRPGPGALVRAGSKVFVEFGPIY